ncbi:unnamed protein product [Ilex paraguariensis]|uniref:Fe2OG dioxygenase domain-containing protein n=1 Tax=Ilex paraguariensis TaxID=185542 RepID=A0ABC8RW40_9AQUA
MASQTLPNLPIIDFTMENLKPGTNSWLSARNDVRRALEEYGSFIALYDKVSSELKNGVFDAVKELFDLPKETKSQNVSDKVYHGYVGQLAHIPIHESLSIGDANTLEGVQSFTNLMWPSGNDNFCENILKYAKKIAELEQLVSKMVFESYGVERYYDSHLRSMSYLIRTLKYREPKIDETNTGADIHTDKTFITILHQNQVPGLQLQARNGDWIDVDFPPESFVIIAGDASLAWSNDRIHSPRHQVILREKKTRYTVGVFAYNTGTTDIPQEMVDDEHPLQFRSFDNMGLLQSYFDNPTRLSEETARSYCGIRV